MTETHDASQRHALGAFLRTCRGKLTPGQAGLPPGSRRRTPGLRREELAQLAGLSVTWLTWIEQGRPVSVSVQALARIADALRLSPAERSYLFELGGKKDPRPDIAPATAPQAVLDAVHAIDGPAYVLDRYWNALSWNQAASRLFVGWLDADAPPHNLLRYTFQSEAARSLIRDWAQRARRLAAEFRAESGHYPDDPEMARLIDSLSAESPSFRQYWGAQDVLEREGGERAFDHPADGALRYRQVSLCVAHRTDLKLVMLIEGEAGRDQAPAA